ncbi:MAG: hypothetical protein ACYDAR_05420 [Thermomicrobiales bacterium]
MMKSRSRYIHLILAICLVSVLLVSGQGGVHAARDADVATVNRVFRALATSGAVQPIDAAIWEANAIDCLNKNPNLDAKSCALRQVPQVLVPALTAYGLTRLSLAGLWATFDIEGTSKHPGTIQIAADNTGNLVSNQPGYAAFNFYKENGTDFGVPTDLVISFTYNHIIGTGSDDRGYGVLIQTDDGCKMYGRFYSANDPNTLGTLYLARC